MTSEGPLIRNVTIEAFRGFLEPQTILLDASATIIAGPNGSGKTSLFDAVQWLMLGQIDRLASLAGKRSGEYVVNSFAPQGQHATVSAELRLNDTHVVVRREGTAKENTLSWQKGAEALTGSAAEQCLRNALLGESELALRDALLTSGLLQQDVVRAVLEDQPKDRYRHMAGMLGLTQMAGFEDVTKASAASARNEAATALEALERLQGLHAAEQLELGRLEQRAISGPEIQSALRALQERLSEPDHALHEVDLPTTTPAAVSLGQWVRRVRNEASELIRSDRERQERTAALHPVQAKDVEQVKLNESTLRAALNEDREAAAEAQLRLESTREQTSRVVELAAVALPLLGESCPVCDQRINKDGVAARLHKILELEGGDLAGLRDEVARTRAKADESAANLQVVSEERTELEARRAQIQMTEADHARWLQRCRDLVEDGEASLDSDLTGRLLSGERSALEEIRASADLVAGVADELAALLGASGLSDEISRLRTRVEQLRSTLTESQQAAAERSALAADATALSAAASEAVAGVARRRFSTLQPLLDDIFRRLDPHPVFRSLGLDLTVAYRSGVADAVVRTDKGVTRDPLLVFSSSQANVAALTYFLGVSWAAGPQALPFLLLDDPLQSMDDVNALGFSDLCRHIRAQRQLLISTHDRRLSGLLERKLAPRSSTDRTRVVRFVGWDESGPQFQTEEILPDADAAFLLAAQ